MIPTTSLIDQFLAAVEDEKSHAAIELLGVDRRGATEVAYHEEAMEIWRERVSEEPDDVDALHHLAIAYHARAFDREFEDAHEAVQDWAEAHRFWYRLCSRDEFWKRFEQRVAKGAEEACKKARAAVPSALLRVHLEIAVDTSLPLDRRRTHIEIAKSSPFAATHLEDVRSSALEDWLKRLSDDVWDTDDDKLLMQAAEHVENFLDIDPRCEAALVQAASFLLRWAQLQVRAVNAASSDDSGGVRAVVKAAKHWSTYWDVLVEVGSTNKELNDNLSNWHWICAQSYALCHQPDAALRCLDLCVGHGKDDNDVRELRQELQFAKAKPKIEAAQSALSDGRWTSARDAANDVIRLTHGSWPGYLLRAQANLGLRQFTAATNDTSSAGENGAPRDQILQMLALIERVQTQTRGF